MHGLITDILASPPVSPEAGDAIGASRADRPVRAFICGGGRLRISLIAGCHADEPVGPRLLRHLVSYLTALPSGSALLRAFEWWIVPHVNPDGEEANRSWQVPDAAAYDLEHYLRHAVREPPGDDVEFGFPSGPDDGDARPENRAVASWWSASAGPFHLHATLHGMAFAAGPWFLVEEAWKDRIDAFKTTCRDRTRDLGYRLHDVERRGQKGFFRIERGFCTRPDSRHMRRYFLDQGDPVTAGLFRPSSMETIRALGGDPLTLVSEMPLFITPGAGEDIGPPDPVAEEWKRKITAWQQQLARGRPPERIRACARSGCLYAMPIRDQMTLQWTMIVAGIRQAEESGNS